MRNHPRLRRAFLATGFVVLCAAVPAVQRARGQQEQAGPNLPTGRLRFGEPIKLKHEDGVRDLAFSPDGRFLASGGDDRKVQLWDARSGRNVRSFGLFRRNATQVVFSPDSSLIAATSLDASLKVWEVGSGREVFGAKAPGGEPFWLDFAPDGRSLALATQEGMILLVPLSTQDPA